MCTSGEALRPGDLLRTGVDAPWQGGGQSSSKLLYMVDPAHDRAAHRVTKVALMVAAVTAVTMVALSTFGLRWAHTYRQGSQEGLAFMLVSMGLVAASAVAMLAVAVLLWARARTTSRQRRFYAVIAAGLVALVTGAAAFAIYAQSHVQRCFGPCG